MIDTLYRTTLETLLKKAVGRAVAEKIRVGDYFTEESLRYLVMLELTQQRDPKFPTFPNKKSGPVIMFQYPYDRTANTNKSKMQRLKKKSDNNSYRPDIVCAKMTPKGTITQYYFAIELKHNSNESDIQKCKEYVDSTTGASNFPIAIVIDLGSFWRWEDKFYKNVKSTKSKGNILWITTDDQGEVKSRWFLFE
jgi:hypothetical protein